MRTGNMKNTFNWILIFGLILFTVLLDKAGPVLFPSVTMVKYASLVVLIGTLPILIFTLNKIKRTNEELRKSKLKLKNIFDTLDVAIWSHDLKTNTLLITPGIEKLYGYTLNDFYEDLTLWKKVIYPEDFQIIDDREWRIALGEAVTSEYRIIRPDGEVRWIRDRGFPTLDHKGNFVDFNSVLFDITDRKESEYRYRSLVEMSPDFIAVFSRGKIEYINEAGRILVGAASIEELIGQSSLNFAPSHIIERIKSRLSEIDYRNKEKSALSFRLNDLTEKVLMWKWLLPRFYMRADLPHK